MKKEIINTEKAPKAIGPYSQAVKFGDFIFTSGQIPIDPESGELISDISKATSQCIENLKCILKEAGTSLNNVIKTVIYMRNLEEFSIVNQVYATYFTENQPARSCVEVSALPKDAIIEIEAVAYIDSQKE
ncbi:MAG TPA: RidA family protein [Clostridiaceae bacterium]